MKTESQKRTSFKSLPISPEKKLAIYSYLDYSYSIKNIPSLTSILYKGENYLVVVRQVPVSSIKPSPSKYKALKELKDFLGTKGNAELSSWDSNLTPSKVKRSMKIMMENNSSYYERMLFRFQDQNVNQLKRIRSNAGTYTDIFNEVKYDWSNTASGRKSQTRKDNQYTREKRKRIFGDVYSNMVGGVHTESGLYLRAYKEKLTKILDLNKKPMTSERHVGLELEFMMPYANKQAIKEKLLASPFANLLCLGRDGSVSSSDKYEGAELKICTPLSQLTDVVSFVSSVLAVNGCSVDKSCGFHVHLDARNDNAKTMFTNLLDQQASLFALVPSSRRNNTYCRPTTKKDYLKGSRYKSINSTAYNKFKTLEVRLHGGTIDPNKIIYWTLLLSSIAYNETKITKSRTVTTMLKKLNLGDSMKSFFIERAATFSKHGSVVAAND